MIAEAFQFTRRKLHRRRARDMRLVVDPSILLNGVDVTLLGMPG